ncbi:MAG: hypothetical protein Q4D51_13795 [Eubacteriales bacterium]|nr:hypothetical protein [Eubacteriales bacterium]
MGITKVTIISYECPSCGASINIDPEQTKATCEYCGAQFAIEREQEAPKNEPPRNAGYNNTARNSNQELRKKAQIFIPIIVVSVLLVGVFFINVIGGIFVALATRSSSTQRTEQKLVEVDPFKDIKVNIEGKEPWARVTSVTNNDTSLRGISYNLDKKTGLSNGDVITIQAEEMRGYRWTNVSYEYTVSGLDTIVREMSQLSDADKDFLFQEAQKEIEKDWEDNLQNTDISKDGIKLNIQPYQIYINVNKNEDSVFLSSDNTVFPVFEITFEGNGKNYTYYQYADIDNVYLSSDGSLHGDFNTMGVMNGFEYFQDLEDDFVIHGFDSVVKMESNMEKDDFKLIK